MKSCNISAVTSNALNQTFCMDDNESGKMSKVYGPKKLSEESIASIILEMEKNKKVQ